VRFTIQFNLIVSFLEIYTIMGLYIYIPISLLLNLEKKKIYSIPLVAISLSTGLLIKYFYNIIVTQYSFQITILGWKLV